ncbi:hypothetical protein IE53DRAFT_387651 [Violaceomyces palustris]|uniref:Uncharacterized protein n=1 Tax=Violaceomyces palustris TaxID=1673888 RepID=A0ACD0NWF3_9BASI|nr:hypothetical protein IE53DRAFT_387651 [Violaceomyces palustris]
MYFSIGNKAVPLARPSPASAVSTISATKGSPSPPQSLADSAAGDPVDNQPCQNLSELPGSPSLTQGQIETRDQANAKVRKNSLRRSFSSLGGGKEAVSSAKDRGIKLQRKSSKLWQPRWAPNRNRGGESDQKDLDQQSISDGGGADTSSPTSKEALHPLDGGVSDVPPILSLTASSMGLPFGSTDMFGSSPLATPVRHERSEPSTLGKPLPDRQLAKVSPVATDSSPALGAPFELPPRQISSYFRVAGSRSSAASSETIKPARSIGPAAPNFSPALGGLINSFPSPALRNKKSSDLAASSGESTPSGEGWDGGEKCFSSTTSVKRSSSRRFSEQETSFEHVLNREKPLPESPRGGVCDARQTNRSPDTIRRKINPPPVPAPAMSPPPAPASSPNKIMRSGMGSGSDVDNALRTPPPRKLQLNPQARNAPADFPLKRLTLEARMALGNGSPQRSQAWSLSAQAGSFNTPRNAPLGLVRAATPSTPNSGEVSPNHGRLSHETDASPSPGSSIYMTGNSSTSSLDSNLILGTTTGGNVSTGDIAKSLAIPREAIKQMLETSQVIWRTHGQGSGSGMENRSSELGFYSKSQGSRSDDCLSTHLSQQARSGGRDPTNRQRSPVGATSSRPSSASASIRPYSKGGGLTIFDPSVPSWQKSVATPKQQSIRSTSLDEGVNRHSVREAIRMEMNAMKRQNSATSSPNFSRPIPLTTRSHELEPRPEAGGLVASAEDQVTTVGPLQGPLSLKGAAQRHEQGMITLGQEDEDREEILIDPISTGQDQESNGWAGMTWSSPSTNGNQAPSPESPRFNSTPWKDSQFKLTRSNPRSLNPDTNPPPSPRHRRNSDSGLVVGPDAPFRRRPGDLHAWTVFIDEQGIPSVRATPSAFHTPDCSLAGKGNATWQCGCRSYVPTPWTRASTSDLPRPAAHNLTRENLNDPSSVTKFLRTMSSAPDLSVRWKEDCQILTARQDELKREVERHSQQIERHQREIDELQAAVTRMSSDLEMESRTFNSGSLSRSSSFGRLIPQYVHSSKHSVPTSAPQPSQVVPKNLKATEEVQEVTPLNQPLPLTSEEVLRSPQTILNRKPNAGGSLRKSLSHSQLPSFGSVKKFTFPWHRRNNSGVEQATITPFPGSSNPPTRKSSLSSFPQPRIESTRPSLNLSNERPLPPTPKEKKSYPPSSRKASFDALSRMVDPNFRSAHIRDPSSASSRASSYATGYTYDSSEFDARYSFLPSVRRRWDSISSKGTSISEGQAQDPLHERGVFAPKRLFGSLASNRSSQDGVGSPRNSFKVAPAPPRRSSLKEIIEKKIHYPGSKDVTADISPIGGNPQEIASCMAPISEISEGGTPTSAKVPSVAERNPSNSFHSRPTPPTIFPPSQRSRFLSHPFAETQVDESKKHAANHGFLAPRLGLGPDRDLDRTFERNPSFQNHRSKQLPPSPRSATSTLTTSNGYNTLKRKNSTSNKRLPVAIAHGSMTVVRSDDALGRLPDGLHYQEMMTMPNGSPFTFDTSLDQDEMSKAKITLRDGFSIPKTVTAA